jgi:fluoroquinolone resistance protein
MEMVDPALLQTETTFKHDKFEHCSWPPASIDQTFSHCEFEGVSFNDTDLEECHFIACQFLNCLFNSSRMVNCRFKDSSFYDKPSETGTPFKHASLRASQFLRCDFSLGDFSRANLYESTWHECQMTGSNLSQTTASHSINGTIEIHQLSITDSNLAYVCLVGARLPESEFTGNRMSHAQLDDADLTNANLSDCELHGIEATGVNLRGADLRGASFSGLDVRSIDMTGVRIDAGQSIALLETLGIIID